MNEPEVSVVISTYNRYNLWKRTLHALATRPPSRPFEVVVVDDLSSENVLGLLRNYSSAFPWKFILFDRKRFTRETGVAPFFNNPAATNNVGVRHSRGKYIYLQGNEVIPWGKAYDELYEQKSLEELSVCFSTTYDVPPEVLNALDPYGVNLNREMLTHCSRYVLASPFYHSDVINYLTLLSRPLWDAVGGLDERFLAGIGKEDSDFIRRCRAIPGWKDVDNMVRSEAISLHQSHGGRTRFYPPDPSVITEDRWKEGEKLSKEVWDLWDGTHFNRQPWEPGTVGIIDVITNEVKGV